jgi:hypothetical protein
VLQAFWFRFLVDAKIVEQRMQDANSNQSVSDSRSRSCCRWRRLHREPYGQSFEGGRFCASNPR